MLDHFEFDLNNRIFHGVGWTRTIGELLENEGYRVLTVYVDEGVRSYNPYFEEIFALLGESDRTVRLEVLRGSAEPDYDYLGEAVEQARALEIPDVIIGIGGGSTMDIAKTVAALLTNEGSAIDYRGMDMMTVPQVDTIIIPTTAGTGSEATTSAPFVDHEKKVKLGINGRYMNAKYSVLDAEWTMSCPTSVAVSSGVDALVHTLESFMTTKANELSRALNRESFRILIGALPCLTEDPENKDKRQALLLGAYLAGLALYNTGSGIAGALSYPLGVHYDIPHGIGGGIFIAAICRFNVDHGYFEYADLLDAVEPHPDWTVEQKSRRFVELLEEVGDKIGVPRTLAQWGVTKIDLDRVVELMQPMQGAFDQNPIAFSVADDVRPLLSKFMV